jgi:phenylalanyl-tRNA synthetase beta chain
MQRNQSFREQRIRLFETGLRFRTQGDDIEQQLMISGLITGSREPLNWEDNQQQVDFYDLKADIEALCGISASAEEYSVEAANIPALHPGQSAKLMRNSVNIGYFGAIHPRISKKLKLPGTVYLFELALDDLSSAKIPEYQEWSKFPASTRDLAVVIDESVTGSELIATVKEAGGKRLTQARIFDIYRGKGVDFGRKSIALGLTFSDFSDTLKDTEVTDLIDKIINRLSERYDATLRD